MRPEGVVATDAGLGGAAEMERLGELVRVRPRCRVHDRVRAVDELQLFIAPGGPLGSFVRAVADLDRILLQRLARICRVEQELDQSQSPSCVLLKSLNG